MVARYNADLANNFGNLANRVLNMAVNYCGGVVPTERADGPLVDAVADRVRDRRRSRSSGSTSRRRSARCGTSSGPPTRTSRTRKPWALNKAGDTAATAAVIGDCLEALRVVALLASPAIPRAAAAALAAPRAARRARPTSASPTRSPGVGCRAGAPLEKGEPLFPRIET